MTAAIAHGTAPFPVGQVQGSQFTALDAILGEEFQGTKGKIYRLVKASAAEAAPASKVYKRTSAGSDAVSVATQDSAACGVAVADQVALAEGDYFFLQVAGEVTLIKDGTLGAGLLLETENAGAVSNSASTGTTFDPNMPARAHTVAGTVVTAYLLQKLMG